MLEAECILRADGIEKSYGSTRVLSSAALWAVPGTVTALLGRNGSGKTTLLRIAAGDLKPDNGFISFQGTARTSYSLPRAAREGLMYLPQGQLLCPGYRLEQHFSALTSIYGDSNLNEAISLTRVESLMRQCVSTFSGGERMRASMALALARRPEVLIADEPLVSLSPLDQSFLGGILQDLASRGTAVITSGHDTGVLLEISDTVLWSVAGTTHHLGTPAEARQYAQFRSEYLGTSA